MKKKKRKYTIHCEEEHLLIMAEALEMYSRMRCGQLEESYLPPIQDKMQEIIHRGKNQDDPVTFQDAETIRREVRQCFLRIKKLLWNLGESVHYGIGHDSKADFSYEIYKEMLYRIHTDKQEDRKINGEKNIYSVHASPPLRLTNKPKIKVESTEKRSVLTEKNKKKWKH